MVSLLSWRFPRLDEIDETRPTSEDLLHDLEAGPINRPIRAASGVSRRRSLPHEREPRPAKPIGSHLAGVLAARAARRRGGIRHAHRAMGIATKRKPAAADATISASVTPASVSLNLTCLYVDRGRLCASHASRSEA